MKARFNNRRCFARPWALAVLGAGLMVLSAAREGRSDETAPTRALMRELSAVDSPRAHQAAAVDVDSFYAIANREIARYDKVGGKLRAAWKAPADSSIQHLNSGVVIEGKLYCAHSNWPRVPLKNSIEVWDAGTLRHERSIPLARLEGALTWLDFHDGHWWLAEAFYGTAESVRRTTIHKCDAEWQPLEAFSVPDSIVQRFLPYSNSGGSWGPDGLLYLTGHDHKELYATRLPDNPNRTLVHVTTVPTPVSGQGIAWDRWDIGTLYGIRRSDKQVVACRQSHRAEFTPLALRLQWTRDPRNPILPPRTADPTAFDATRCMNPWVRRSGQAYHLYYSGGDRSGRQRIGRAIAPVDELTEWRREGPLFETGAAGEFDARWCVLPHVVERESGSPSPSVSPDTRLRLYYTGNAGRGTGLSAFPGIGLAESERGGGPLDWKKHPQNPVLAPSGEPGTADAIGIAGGSLLQVSDSHEQPRWWFYYTGCPTVGEPLHLNQQKTICLAVSRDGVTWEKRGAVLLRDPQRDYEDIGVAGPVVQRTEEGGFRMWYSAIGTRWGYYSICYAESDDGIHWRRGATAGENLQLAPTGDGWEAQMVEYPTVIREGEGYRMFYCGNGYGRTGIGTARGEVKEGE